MYSLRSKVLNLITRSIFQSPSAAFSRLPVVVRIKFLVTALSKHIVFLSAKVAGLKIFEHKHVIPSSVHSHSTRQSCNRNLYVASVNTTQYGLHSLKFAGPRLWNSLPTCITNTSSLRIFRKTLKTSILNYYSN